MGSQPSLSNWRMSGGALFTLVLVGCAGPVDVFLEITDRAPVDVTAIAQWGQPGRGFLPSRGESVIVEAVPVVADGAGKWAVHDVPRTKKLGFNLASVHWSWTGPEPASVTVRFSEQEWDDQGRRHHVLTMAGDDTTVTGWAGFDEDLHVTLKPERLLGDVHLRLALHRRLPSERSSIEEAGANRLHLWLRTRDEQGADEDWDLTRDPVELDVFVVAQAMWATVPWTYRRSGVVGGYALVEQANLAWLATNGQRADVQVAPGPPVGLYLKWTHALPSEQVYVLVARRAGDALAWVGAMAPKYPGFQFLPNANDGTEFDPEKAVDPAF